MAISNVDTLSAQYEYGPFGEAIRATGPMAKANPFRFSTKYQDDETGLLYYGYRYYNASTGRWISRDSIVEEGGLKLCGFVHNGPINNADSLGHTPLADVKVASAIGGALQANDGTTVLSTGNALIATILGVQAQKEDEAILMDYWHETVVGEAVDLACPEAVSFCFDRYLFGAGPAAAEGTISRNTAEFEIQTQGGMLARDGRVLENGTIRGSTDCVDQTTVRRVDFDHAHGDLGASHVVDMHANTIILRKLTQENHESLSQGNTCPRCSLIHEFKKELFAHELLICNWIPAKPKL